jgi:hypothetical protein
MSLSRADHRVVTKFAKAHASWSFLAWIFVPLFSLLPVVALVLSASAIQPERVTRTVFADVYMGTALPALLSHAQRPIRMTDLPMITRLSKSASAAGRSAKGCVRSICGDILPCL